MSFKKLEESKTDELGHEMILREASHSFKQSAFPVRSRGEQHTFLREDDRTIKNLEDGKPLNTEDDRNAVSSEKSAFQTEGGETSLLNKPNMTVITPASPAPVSCFKESDSVTNVRHVFSVNEVKNVRDFPPGSGASILNKPDTLGPEVKPLFPVVSAESVTLSEVISSQPISAEAAVRVSLTQLPSETGREQERTPVRVEDLLSNHIRV